jgi:ubiquinone/menaquinone biosynthesis C-methylase UbiE
MKALWRRLVIFGFRLLYNELAWLYDPVSYVVSQGKWRQWQATLWPYLPARGRVLEVAPGPGHLLVRLAMGGYEAVGLDLSPAMLRLARRRLRRRGLTVPLCRGRAEALPFAPGRFDAVVVTFPTGFAYDPRWIGQLPRLLKEDGRLVMVDTSRFAAGTLAQRLLEWLYRITGQRGPAPDLAAPLEAGGLRARQEWVEVGNTAARLLVAQRQGLSRRKSG